MWTGLMVIVSVWSAELAVYFLYRKIEEVRIPPAWRELYADPSRVPVGNPGLTEVESMFLLQFPYEDR